MWVLVDLCDRELFMINKRKEILKFKFHSLKKGNLYTNVNGLY